MSGWGEEATDVVAPLPLDFFDLFREAVDGGIFTGVNRELVGDTITILDMGDESTGREVDSFWAQDRQISAHARLEQLSNVVDPSLTEGSVCLVVVLNERTDLGLL